MPSRLTNISANGGTFSSSSFVINPSLSQCFEKRVCIAGKFSASTYLSFFESNSTNMLENLFVSCFSGLQATSDIEGLDWIECRVLGELNVKEKTAINKFVSNTMRRSSFSQNLIIIVMKKVDSFKQLMRSTGRWILCVFLFVIGLPKTGGRLPPCIRAYAWFAGRWSDKSMVEEEQLAIPCRKP